MGLAGAGAGAGEGLDTYLNRLLVQQEVEERGRHNMATEDTANQSLRQQAGVQQSLEDLRSQQGKVITDREAKDAARDKNRADMLADPNVPDAVKIALRTYSALPEGDKTFPYQLIQPPTKPAKSLQNHFGDIDVQDNGVSKHLKNVPFNYNPEDGSLSFNGQKLDPANVHGVVSPSMAAAGLQWDPAQGLIINKAAGTAKTVTGPDGGVLTPDLTSASRTMREGATALMPHIKDVAAQAEALDKAGLFGPVMSRVRDIATKAGTIDEFYDALSSDPTLKNDENAGRFATSLGLLATGAGRVHGGARGGGSPQMFEHFKHMLSDTSTVAMFKGRLGAVNDFMQGYSQMGNQPGAAAPGAAGAVDPYQEYLNRTQPKKD